MLYCYSLDRIFQYNTFSLYQSHLGIKGRVMDTRGNGIADATISVRDLTTDDYIDHDITTGRRDHILYM